MSTTFVAAFAKGLRVIAAFDAQHRRMTLSEVAERTGFDRAAARRFLLTLVEVGYAKQDGKHFQLTPKVLELGFAYLASLGLPSIMEPILERVSDALDESSSVAVLDDLDVVYVARVQTQRIMSVGLGVGSRLPAATTSMGRVLLAQLDPKDLAERLGRCRLEAHTPRTLTKKRDLLRTIEQIRKDGFAVVDQELEEGLRSIAVPITNRSGEVVAAINVGTLASRVPKQTLLKHHLAVLREAAASAREALV
ncbi:MAG: IclR family transcriptional regulator C-terminal domain-containing protein [Deltaproteobacteria bacterium]